MTPLEREMAAIIAAEGPISLEQFMLLAASHPKFGYYRSGMPIGRSGDFVTAPEIHQMFGELIGLWAAEIWRAMGEPQTLSLVELGPGRGTLMVDFLRAARIVPNFLAALEIHLVEISERLAGEQRERLQAFESRITWHRSIDDLPQRPSIIIANEFFDALPVRHYIRTEQGWNERRVGLNEHGRLAFVLAPTPDVAIAGAAPIGSIIEIGLVAQRLMGQLAAHIAEEGGVLLAIDYGYRTKRTGETLQAIKDHVYVDPLATPGEADITAHVDFAALERAASATGAEVYGPVAQGTWLARLGIFERAAVLKRAASKEQGAAIDAALMRLAQPGPTGGLGASMAELFQVLCVASHGLVPPGFDVPLAKVSA